MAELTFPNKKGELTIQLKQLDGTWLMERIPELQVGNQQDITYGQLEAGFAEQTGNDFVLFWNSPPIIQLRNNGLLML